MTDLREWAAKHSDRFWSKVERSDGCWRWLSCMSDRGYPRIRIEGRQRFAHRLSLMIATGIFETPLFACHRCNNPGCVNPSHLYWGTHRENILDAARAGTMSRAGRHWQQIHPEMRLHGTKNGRAVLVEADVRAIRAATESEKRLAARFGVSRSLIGQIRRREAWAHLD